MKSLTFLVPFFIDEFQILYDSGFAFVDRSRITVAPTEDDGLSRPEVQCQIAAALPDILPDAEHSVLIACFAGSSAAPGGFQTTDPLTSSKACFLARDCCGLIPLTKRAREILSGRLDGAVKLTEPFFEEIIAKRFADREILNSITGGNALAELLILNPASFDLSSLSRVANTGNDDMALIRTALKYTRYKPMAAQPISGLRDLGKILSDTLPNPKELSPPLTRLAAWGSPRWETATGFKRVYGDAEILQILDAISAVWNLPASATGLGIFLHWRYMSQKAQGLDLKALETDCREMAGCVPGQYLAEALWLLGYCAGFGSFAGNYYAAQESAHPFGAKRQTLKRILLLSPKSVAVSASEPVSQGESGQMGTVPSAEEGIAHTEDLESRASPTPVERLDGASQGSEPDESTDEMPASASQPSPESSDSRQAGSDREDAAPTTIKDEPCPEPSNEPVETNSPSIVDTAPMGDALIGETPQKKKAEPKRPNIAGSGGKKAAKPASDLFQAATEPDREPGKET